MIISQLFKRWSPLEKLQQQRDSYVQQALPNSLSSWLSTPLPQSDSLLSQLEYLVLDFETTGFDPEKDDILSVGFVTISQQRIDLSTATELLIKDSQQKVKPETAIINHLTTEKLAHGVELDCAMAALFNAMKGKIMVAHGAMIEQRFLNHYLATRYQLPPLPIIWLDTLTIEKSLSIHRQQLKANDYRLAQIRQRHGLPAYPAHGAVIDAIATAELLLVLQVACFGKKTGTLANWLK
ncbi:exonuclease domain-containing protein [Photobacterium damselae]|uniref:3'-5' exonuclease n=1 Tax=Photobacterium damselae TaxID=38293 RepID=UPI0011D0FC6A|nr:exonuclease domain-containing protein [Photobacterium damselae]KAB1517036.1 3'-5' exonuclease [Photobacterium damselae subsp. damselae]